MKENFVENSVLLGKRAVNLLLPFCQKTGDIEGIVAAERFIDE